MGKKVEVDEDELKALQKSKEDMAAKMRDVVNRANMYVADANEQNADARNFVKELRDTQPVIYAKMLRKEPVRKVQNEDMYEDEEVPNTEVASLKIELEEMKSVLRDTVKALSTQNQAMKNRQVIQELKASGHAPDLDDYMDKIEQKAQGNPALLADPEFMKMAYDSLSRDKFADKIIKQYEEKQAAKIKAQADAWSPEQEGLGDLDLDAERLSKMDAEDLSEELFASAEPAISRIRAVERDMLKGLDEEGDSD